jgi:flagellar hook-associated protein 2
MVHEIFSVHDLVRMKAKYPDGQVIAHPECPKTILEHAEFIGGTEAMIKHVGAVKEPTTFIVATEPNMMWQLESRFKQHKYVGVPGITCACNKCPHMAKNTLEKIRDKINAANAGVTASLITDASGARLVVRGSSSGEENGFRISVADADGGNGDGTGLSALAYDPSADITSMNRSQKAANAKATINGIEVNSDTNTLKDVVDGLTITLKKVTDTATESKPIELTVDQDLTAIRTGIDAFAKAYNDAIGLIRTQTMYDAESKTGGPLQGDSTAVGLLNQLRSMAGTGTTASTMYSRLSDIGLQMGKEGTFTTNGTKLDKALKDNLNEVRKFFSTANDTDPNAAGMGQRFYKMANQIAGSDGSIAARQDGIKSTIKRNEKKIDDIDNRLTLVEARLRAQYTALDNNMTKLNSLSAYVAQQLSVLTNS